jgi:hypothetical protein
MLLRDAVLCWTPNRHPFAGYPTAGQLFVTTVPLPRHDYGHVKTYGRVNREWTEATAHQRRSKLQRLFTQMIHEDMLAEADVRKALSVIDDILVVTLSAEAPELEGQD